MKSAIFLGLVCTCILFGADAEAAGNTCLANERGLVCGDRGQCNSDGTACICDPGVFSLPDLGSSAAGSASDFKVEQATHAGKYCSYTQKSQAMAVGWYGGYLGWWGQADWYLGYKEKARVKMTLGTILLASTTLLAIYWQWYMLKRVFCCSLTAQQQQQALALVRVPAASPALSPAIPIPVLPSAGSDRGNQGIGVRDGQDDQRANRTREQCHRCSKWIVEEYPDENECACAIVQLPNTFGGYVLLRCTRTQWLNCVFGTAGLNGLLFLFVAGWWAVDYISMSLYNGAVSGPLFDGYGFPLLMM